MAVQARHGKTTIIREKTTDTIRSHSSNDEIRLKRDSLRHCWAMAVGGHWVPLPWKESADAVSVVLWLKEQTNGVVAVKIEW